MDGGLTFLPHPPATVSTTSGLGTSTIAGGANTTAVEEMTAVDDVTAAPTGILGAPAFAFWPAFLRTGANASAADQAF